MFQVLRHFRHKYACRQCDAAGESPQIVAAEKPSQPLDKGLAGPGSIAFVATSKFQDHLPLYRLEQIFARQQVHIPRSTMCAWLAAGAEVTEPPPRNPRRPRELSFAERTRNSVRTSYRSS